MNHVARMMLAALLLVAPIAAAENPNSQTLTMIQLEDGGASVIHRVDWMDVAASSYEARAEFYVPLEATSASFFLWPSTGVRQPIDAADVTSRTAPANNATQPTWAATGFRLYEVDLNRTQSSVADGADYAVTAEYQVPTATARFLLRYASSVAAFATPLEGYTVQSAEFGPFTEVSGNALHAAKAGAQADDSITIEFVHAGGAPVSSQDQTKYVWGLMGVLLGLFLFYVAARQGWINAPGKAKKFVKGGAMESKTMLDARRRTLLAALKELEVAHEAKEIPDDAYSPLKEEYKAQAVRVMRNLEEKKEA